MGRIGIILASIATLAVVAASLFTIYAQNAALDYKTSHFYAGQPVAAYASFACHEQREAIDWHCIEDWNVLTPSSVAGLGYASFDAKPVMRNTVDQDHLVGFQSRPVYEGSADLTGYFHGVNSRLQHFGTGTIETAHGVHIFNAEGDGQIDELVALYIENQTKGAVNAGIVSHNSVNYLDGVQTNRLDVADVLVLPRKSVSQLLTIEGPEGAFAFGNDACKPGQFAMLCDGAPVYWSRGDWRTMHDGRAIATYYQPGIRLGR